MEVELVDGRITVVTALPLKPAARHRLADLLGARVVDVRDEVDRADLVLTPSSSPQLIGALQRKYPDARIVVVELDDEEFDVDLPGPVKRLLRSGADGYVLAESIDELAHKLVGGQERATEVDDMVEPSALPAASAIDDVVAEFLRESTESPTTVRRDQPPR